MTSAADIQSLSERMYQGQPDSDEVGRRYFLRFAQELAACDFEALLAYQLEAFPRAYVVEFLCSTDFLWRPLGAAVWPRVLNRPRPAPSRPMSVRNLDSGAYGDVEFLSRLVEVDGLGFILESPLVELDARRKAFQFFQLFPFGLMRREEDDEGLDGERYVDRRVLAEIRNELLTAHGFRELVDGPETLLEACVRRFPDLA